MRFGHQVQEVGQEEETLFPVELMHTALDVMGEVEGAQEADLVAVALEDLANLEGKHGTIRVAGQGLWSPELFLLNSGVVLGNNLGNGLEWPLALIEATSTREVGESAVEARGQTRDLRFVQGGFDLARVVFDTIDNQDLFGTTLQSKVADLVNRALVSSFGPPVTEEGLLGCSDIVEMALEDDRAADLEVADNANRDGLTVGSLGDSNLDTGHASTDRGEPQVALLVVCRTLGVEDGTSACPSHTETRNNDMGRDTVVG